MDPTDTILTSGFRLGRLFHVTWWVNCLFPVVTLAFIWNLQDVSLGLIAAGILLASVVLHELAHLVVSRSLGGDMDQIQLWPLGGLAHPHGRGYLTDHARVLFSGPLLNLVIALSCMIRLSNQQLTNMVQHFTIQMPPDVTLFYFVIQLTFAVNMLLFLVNLIPVVPFDAGIFLRTYLTNRLSEVEGREIMIRSGLAMGIFGMLLGFVFGNAPIVAVTAFLVILHTHENMKWIEMLTSSHSLDLEDEESKTNPPEVAIKQSEDVEDEFDFGPPLMPMSELSHPQSDDFPDNGPNSLQHEEVLDEILEKLHIEGRDSLSDLEVELLEQLSDRIRRQRRSSL